LLQGGVVARVGLRNKPGCSRLGSKDGPLARVLILGDPAD
jgi:hypothetical protein